MSRSRLITASTLIAALCLAGAGSAGALAHGLTGPAARHAAAGGPMMGTQVMHGQATFQGYYDGHKDTYLSTDTSSKADAAAMHINYSASLAGFHGAPSIYFIEGAHAAAQIAVFGSEPGESDYSPLWQEVIVRFKGGAKPVLLTSDNQINALAKKGKVSATTTKTILNCPIIKVGK